MSLSVCVPTEINDFQFLISMKMQSFFCWAITRLISCLHLQTAFDVSVKKYMDGFYVCNLSSFLEDMFEEQFSPVSEDKMLQNVAEVTEQEPFHQISMWQLCVCELSCLVYDPLASS